MTYIFLAIIGISSVLLIRSNWKQEHQIVFILTSTILGLIIFLILFNTFSDNRYVQKGTTNFFREIPWLEIWLYFVMIIGMASKYFFDAIGTEKKKRIQLRKWQLIKPMFISPIVFGVIYASLNEINSILLLSIFAFQNGFFWDTVLRNKY